MPAVSGGRKLSPERRETYRELIKMTGRAKAAFRNFRAHGNPNRLITEKPFIRALEKALKERTLFPMKGY